MLSFLFVFFNRYAFIVKYFPVEEQSFQRQPGNLSEPNKQTLNVFFVVFVIN